MSFAVICLDRPETAEFGAGVRLAHLEYIDPRRSKIQIGGALLADDSEDRVGMIFAIDLPIRDAVESSL